ncbi:MAG TPA: hypothetical protein VFT00_05080 [Nocardioides sp.]|nr:hypothetical protein [Nocardioides sp.]
MNDDGRATLPRCAAVWLTTTAGALALGAWLLPDLGDAHRALTGSGLPGPSFDRLLLWLFAAAALAAAGWLWTVTTVVTLEAALGRSPDPAGGRGIPVGLRRLVLTACGVAVIGGLSAPALATPGKLHQDEASTAARTRVHGLPLPATAAPDRVVVVRPGDTLWGLARRQLPRAADDAAVAARCRLIYELNRDLIGDDPDLIHPALRLRLPGS